MFVNMWMTADPVGIAPDATLRQALDLLDAKRLRRLPVLKGSRLVGIFTSADVRKALAGAGPADTDRVRVEEIMNPNPITVSPTTPLEQAAAVLSRSRIGAVPVVEKGKLVGIITETDMFKAFIRMMGVEEGGSRITLKVPHRTDALLEVVQSCDEHAVEVLSIASLYSYGREESMLVLRVRGTETPLLVESLRSRHYNVLDVQS